MAPVTQARCTAHPPHLRLPQPAVAAGVAATSSSCNCNVTELELVLSPLSAPPLVLLAGSMGWSSVRLDMIAPCIIRFSSYPS
jgi:hypothetical protein